MLAVAFVVGWCVCVWQIIWKLGGSPWHAVRVTTVKHCGLVRWYVYWRALWWWWRGWA